MRFFKYFASFTFRNTELCQTQSIGVFEPPAGFSPSSLMPRALRYSSNSAPDAFLLLLISSFTQSLPQVTAHIQVIFFTRIWLDSSSQPEREPCENTSGSFRQVESLAVQPLTNILITLFFCLPYEAPSGSSIGFKNTFEHRITSIRQHVDHLSVQ